MVTPCAAAAFSLMESCRFSANSHRDVGDGRAAEDLGGHGAGLLAEVVVVEAVAGDGAALDAVGVAGDQRDLVLLAHLDDGLERRDGGVVADDGDGVHAADQRLGRGLHLGRGAGRRLDDGEAHGRGVLLGLLDQEDGVGLAGVVDHADVLGVGPEGLGELEDGLDRLHVADAGDVGRTAPPGLTTRPAPTGSVTAVKRTGLSVIALARACAVGVATPRTRSRSSPANFWAMLAVVAMSPSAFCRS